MTAQEKETTATLLYWKFPDASNKTLWAMKAIPDEHLQAAYAELEAADDIELLRSIDGYTLEQAKKIADDVWHNVTMGGLRADRVGHGVAKRALCSLDRLIEEQLADHV